MTQKKEILSDIKKVGDIKPDNAYYATNARMVQLNKPIAQTEPVDGVKYVYSEQPLTAKEIDEWELTKVYEQSTTEKNRYQTTKTNRYQTIKRDYRYRATNRTIYYTIYKK